MKKEMKNYLKIVIAIIIILIIAIIVRHVATVNNSEKDNNVEQNVMKEDRGDYQYNNDINITEDNSDKLSLDFIGVWYDDYDYSEIVINKISDTEVYFDWNLDGIIGYEDLKATFDSDNIATFNTNNHDNGEFCDDVYGYLKFEKDKITLKVTKSECEYIPEGYEMICEEKK